MALKAKDIKKMSKEDRIKQISELKLEMIKARGNAAKGGTSKIKQMKKIIARIHTINKSESEELKNK